MEKQISSSFEYGDLKTLSLETLLQGAQKAGNKALRWGNGQGVRGFIESSQTTPQETSRFSFLLRFGSSTSNQKIEKEAAKQVVKTILLKEFGVGSAVLQRFDQHFAKGWFYSNKLTGNSLKKFLEDSQQKKELLGIGEKLGERAEFIKQEASKKSGSLLYSDPRAGHAVLAQSRALQASQKASRLKECKDISSLQKEISKTREHLAVAEKKFVLAGGVMTNELPNDPQSGFELLSMENRSKDLPA
jgi:hypothetical protein